MLQPWTSSQGHEWRCPVSAKYANSFKRLPTFLMSFSSNNISGRDCCLFPCEIKTDLQVLLVRYDYYV
ncbi:hypothetical protein VPH35_112573 [Triticum aestivum]